MIDVRRYPRTVSEPREPDSVGALDAALDSNPEFARAVEDVAALDAAAPPERIDHRDLIRTLRATG